VFGRNASFFGDTRFVCSLLRRQFLGLPGLFVGIVWRRGFLHRSRSRFGFGDGFRRRRFHRGGLNHRGGEGQSLACRFGVAIPPPDAHDAGGEQRVQQYGQ
jgi:hypothetical protein